MSLQFQIVMPVLNQAAFIGRAIESVLDQAADVPLELVIVDGGSTDGTLDEIERSVARASTRVVVVSESDSGQSDAIEKGMALGSGGIVGWLNADDRFLPGALARVERGFASDPRVAAVYGDVRYVDECGSRLFDLREQDFSRRDLLYGPCYLPQPSTLVARWAWEQVGGLRRDLHYAMDLDLWLRVSLLGPIVHLREVLSEFRVHDGSKSVVAARPAHREAREVRRAQASRELGRVPSRAELEARFFATRCRRRLRGAGRHRGVSR